VKDNLRTMPTLDELDPSKAAALPIEIIEALLVKHALVGNVLLAALVSAHANDTPSPMNTGANGSDRFLDVGEVGTMIGKSRSWVEKNTEALPKRRKVGGEGKWSEREIQQWMKHRETWD
jgi:predicted DNA-binding transcriptional regulator AlpA